MGGFQVKGLCDLFPNESGLQFSFKVLTDTHEQDNCNEMSAIIFVSCISDVQSFTGHSVHASLFGVNGLFHRTYPHAGCLIGTVMWGVKEHFLKLWFGNLLMYHVTHCLSYIKRVYCC